MIFEEGARAPIIRWRILAITQAGRPVSVHESVYLDIFNQLGLAVTQLELRRELDYLRDRGLLEVEGEGTLAWRASLTHHGVDVVEYSVACYPGIARPPR